MSEDEEIDILNGLFKRDLDEAIRKVFFYLDPDSLKQSRCVSWEWNNFIMYRMWNSKPGRKELKKRLEHRWRNRIQVPITQLAVTGSTVVSMECDDQNVYCGLSNGGVQVFNILTGNMEYILKGGWVNAMVGVNSSIVVSCFMYSGSMNFWNKTDWTRLDGSCVQNMDTDIRCLKVTEKNVFTGRADGSISVMEVGFGSGVGDWGQRYLLKNNFGDIKHIESDGEWLIIATKHDIKVFKMEVDTEPSFVTNIPDVATNVALAYPCLLVVNEDNFEGLRVWNLEKQYQLRHIRLNGRMFAEVAINGTRVAIMETIAVDSEEDNFVFVFDLAEICDINIPVDKLWRRVRIYETEGERDAHVGLSSTSLVLSHGKSLNIQDFWKGT